jgi:AcrR family transcriptional regulator
MNISAAIAPAKGRPREFDVEVALAAALRVFWRHGYEAASLTELTREMGITKPSLYACFGNKEALFRKALDVYEREKLAYMHSALDAPTSRGVAERLLLGALDMQASTCGDPKGCMSVISSVSCTPQAESIKEEILERGAASHHALIKRFERARDEGDLPASVDPAGLAHYLKAIMQGLSLQAGAGVTCPDLQAMVDTALQVWPGR